MRNGCAFLSNSLALSLPGPICHSISELNHEKNMLDFCNENESVHVTFFYLQSGCKT